MLVRTQDGVRWVADKYPVKLCARSSALMPLPRQSHEAARLQAALLRAPVNRRANDPQ